MPSPILDGKTIFMTCDRFPNCDFYFLPGEPTSDGKRTYVPVCSAGIPGGCAPLDPDQIMAFDRENSGGKTDRSQGVFYRNKQGVQFGPFRTNDVKGRFLDRYRNRR